MIFVVDHYDSFTYNLVQLLSALGAEVEVARSDAITCDALLSRRPQGILLGPGPGSPSEASLSLALLGTPDLRVPILGVCLGHQAIAARFGGRVVRAENLMHGRTSAVIHDNTGVFHGLKSPTLAMRYHSLIVDRATLPPALRVHAATEAGEIMGLMHRERAIEGVQFHPESFLSEGGAAMMKNWLKRCDTEARDH